MGTLENHHSKNDVISIRYEEIRFRPWAPCRYWAKSGVKRATIVCMALFPALHAAAAAAVPRSVTCSYLQGQELTFDVPKKIGGLPPIEFDYPSKVTRFSFRDDNLLLVAMDQGERSRVRIVISAQRNKVKATYDGQILVDMGGNEIQLYNGPVDCKTSG
jgi:hypothetical protein